MTDTPRVYEQLVANPRQGLRDLGEFLARTGTWYTYEGKPAVLLPNKTLKTVESVTDIQHLIGADIIPILSINDARIRPPFGQILRADLPKLIYADFTHNGHEYFPEADRVVRLPAMHASPLVQAKTGYDAIGKIIYVGEGPSEVDTDGTYPHLKEWLTGLTWESPVHHANTLGIMAAMLCRPAIQRFPIILIEANSHSAGKTTLGQAMGYLLTGELPPGMSYTGNEESFERNLSNYANTPGPNYILVDNVRKKANNASIRSMTLARAITGHVLGFRALYKGTVGLFDPIFVFTMNDAAVEADLGDKVLSVRLSRPEGTAHKKLTPNPLDYVVDHRQELLEELIHLVSGLELVSEGKYTRFYEVETLIYQVAEQLGMRASFSPADVSTTSAIVQEMVYLVQYEEQFSFGEPFSLQKAAEKIQSQPNDYKELATTLIASSIPSGGRGKRLAQLLLFSIHNMTFTLPDQQKYHFLVEGDKLTITDTERTRT